MSKYLLLIILGSISSTVFPSLNDYLYVNKHPTISNYGGIGYIQNPSARFYKEGTLAFSWSHNDPYLRGSILAYPFNWMEASYQYTDVNNTLYSTISNFSGSQSYKDKSFDIKIRLLEERKYFPTLAIGIRDLGGTALFASEYLVANKLVNNNFDLSFGIGWGNLNSNSIKNPFSYISDRFLIRGDNEKQGEGGKLDTDSFFAGDAGYFWGIEYHPPKRPGLKLLLEYDGTNYKTEGPLPLEQSSKLNFGVVKNFSEKFSVKLFQTRGNTLNFGFSYRLSLGEKNAQKIKKIKQAKVENSEIVKRVTSKSDDLLYKASLKYLRENGVNLQKATKRDGSLEIVYAQSLYSNPALSSGRVMSILDDISPKSITHFKVSEVNGGMGIFSASIDRDQFQRLKRFNVTTPLHDELKIEGFNLDEGSYDFNPQAGYPAIFHFLTPELESQIGGPDGFFFGNLKLTLNSEILFSRNLSLSTSLTYGLYDNFEELKLASDSVLPRVRTDIVQYLKQSKDLSIRRMNLSYYGQLHKSLYYKLSTGILESMFAGTGVELLYRPFDKDYGVGLDIWDVKQRAYDQMFDLNDYRTITGFLTLYYQEPKTNILFKIHGGRYLAKDSGFTFDFSRVFRSGLRIGAFFSLTDISAAEFGEGSFDKGFYFWIPTQIFSEKYSRTNWGWGLRPVTRDGAQMLIYANPLWGVTDSASEHLFRRGLDEFYD